MSILTYCTFPKLITINSVFEPRKHVETRSCRPELGNLGAECGKLNQQPAYEHNRVEAGVSRNVPISLIRAAGPGIQCTCVQHAEVRVQAQLSTSKGLRCQLCVMLQVMNQLACNATPSSQSNWCCSALPSTDELGCCSIAVMASSLSTVPPAFPLPAFCVSSDREELDLLPSFLPLPPCASW